VKAKPPTKPHKVRSVAFWIWLLVATFAPLLPVESLTHNVLTYSPPILVCIPAIFAVAIILVKFLLKKANRLDLANFLLCFASSFIIIGFQFPLPTKGTSGQSVRILTTNVEFHNRAVPGLREFIRDRKVDVVMLQEVKGGAQSPAELLKKDLPGWSLASVGDVSILSRWPLSDIHETPLRSLPGRFILSATVNSPKPFRAMTTHWSVPQISKGLQRLKSTIEAQEQDYVDTANAISQETQPVILGGDFNNPPRHGLSRKLSDQMVDAFSSRGFGPGWTYPAQRPMVRIDHLFSNKSNKPIHAEVGPSFGSDHRSLFAEFAIE
jgi:endonuclease/exonuclease/phosphatase (EEP) superfamily protein YafD